MIALEWFLDVVTALKLLAGLFWLTNMINGMLTISISMGKKGRICQLCLFSLL